MIELNDNQLIFRFPEVHPKAECSIDFQRTLRIPDDNREYLLPPGLGRFPVEHVDDYADNLPETWRRHGGVFLPMYQSEALWVNFDGYYPCAVKIAAGKINAVTGSAWDNPLTTDPQDYVVVPDQPWLDGFNISEDLIRQFVAMPLGEEYTAEEQLTGQAKHGGLQIIVYPMKLEVYAEHFERPVIEEVDWQDQPMFMRSCDASYDMGLAPGGLMRQEIYEDDYGLDAWDQENGLRCFVHLVNSEMYGRVTDRVPPHKPPTASDYTKAALPWFDYYSDTKALPGARILSKLTSVAAKVIQKGGKPLADNDPVRQKVVRSLGRGGGVREADF
ncbi:MAG: hypothetical protein P8173_13285 [Gammaproteobacteria bacterium]